MDFSEVSKIPRPYAIVDGHYRCPECRMGKIAFVEESNGEIKDVCENHKQAEAYGIMGGKTCLFVRVIVPGLGGL